MPQHAAVPDQIVPGSAPRIGESQADYRQRLILLQNEALDRRQQELSEQRSPLNTPADRIRIWEQLHQLPLPRSPSHRLISVIAANTGLSLADVRAEQLARAKAKTAAPVV
jgi:hypothetical protein